MRAFELGKGKEGGSRFAASAFGVERFGGGEVSRGITNGGKVSGVASGGGVRFGLCVVRCMCNRVAAVTIKKQN